MARKFYNDWIESALDILPKCFLTDLFYSYWRFTAINKRMPNFFSPKGINEKIHYIKLFNRANVNCDWADKYLVREYVKQKIGEHFLVPLLGVYESVDDINFNELPDQFVLKCTHTSGYNVLCRNRKDFDVEHAKKKLQEGLCLNYYDKRREWVYKNLKPRIVCEKYIGDMWDYKFWCFHGEPRFLQVDMGRFTNHTRNFYDTDWVRQPFKQVMYDTGDDCLKPENFDNMVEIAKKLSKGTKLLRVDLYSINDKIYFGELTFYPGNGLENFEPQKYENILGDLLVV